MGIPITSDQGKEFRNWVNIELMNVFGIQHCLTTAYHPQANGLDEQLNQTLVNSLAKFAQGNRRTWDTKLNEVLYAYNKAHTFWSHVERVARLPIDFNVSQSYDADTKQQEYQDLPASLRTSLNITQILHIPGLFTCIASYASFLFVLYRAGMKFYTCALFRHSHHVWQKVYKKLLCKRWRF